MVGLTFWWPHPKKLNFPNANLKYPIHPNLVVRQVSTIDVALKARPPAPDRAGSNGILCVLAQWPS